jgi:hypothetical protein
MPRPCSWAKGLRLPEARLPIDKARHCSINRGGAAVIFHNGYVRPDEQRLEREPPRCLAGGSQREGRRYNWTTPTASSSRRCPTASG